MDSEELKLQQTAVLQTQSDDILQLTEGSDYNVAVQQQKQDPTRSAKTKKKKQPKKKSATETGGGDGGGGGGVMEHEKSARNTYPGALKRILHLTEGSEHDVAVQQQKHDPTISAKTKKKKQPKTKSATEAGGGGGGGGVMKHDASAGNTNPGAVKRMSKKNPKPQPRRHELVNRLDPPTQISRMMLTASFSWNRPP
jgi:hypothetical protein